MQLAKGRLAPHWRQPAGRMRLGRPPPPPPPASCLPLNQLVYMYANDDADCGALVKRRKHRQAERVMKAYVYSENATMKSE